MQVTQCKVREGAYTTYSLEAVIEGHRIVVEHMLSNDVYAGLNAKDANALIESQLWRHLMHKIEHHLRKTAYANA